MQKSIVIADTSSLILLEKLQMLDVLPQLFSKITPKLLQTNMASRLGINITGIFGVFIVAKNKGIIPRIKPVLEKIRQTNFRFSKKLEIEILRQTNEL